MQERKEWVLDGIDRNILRVLYEQGPLVSRKIADSVNLTSSAIAPRLNNLKKFGLLKNKKTSKIRYFERTFGDKIKKIKSPRTILWSINLKK